jgi:hypothetical protein
VIAIVFGNIGNPAVLCAFREEYPACLVVSENDDLGSCERRLEEIESVVAATPGAVALAEKLQQQLNLPANPGETRQIRTHRFEQRGMASSGTDHFKLVRNAAELAGYIADGGPPLLLRPNRIGDDDPAFVCRDHLDARRILAEFDFDDACPSDWLAEPFKPGRRLGIDTVSHNGRHLIAGIYEHRVDETAGRLVLRHRISLSPGTEPKGLVEVVIEALDQIGIEHGAAHLEIVDSHDGLAVIDVLPAPMVTAVPADAAFAAFGFSHQHLLAEQVLRPNEFQRRLDWPLRSSLSCIAMAPLRICSGAAIEASDGLRVLRRLTGFHSFSCLAPSETKSGTGGVAAIATFVHPDRDSVENSLKVLHEMQDSGFLFGYGQPFFG